MPSLLERTFQAVDEAGQPRRILVVGHGLINELRLMKAIGVDLQNRTEFPSIIGMLDTEILALPRRRGYQIFAGTGRLGAILDMLGIPNRYLHVAGNDAHFTLKVLLMLAAQTLRNPHIDSHVESYLDLLQSIAQSSIEAELSRYRENGMERRHNATFQNWLETAPSLDMDDQSSSSDSTEALREESLHRQWERNLEPWRHIYSRDTTPIRGLLSTEEGIKLLQRTLVPKLEQSPPTYEHAGTAEKKLVLLALDFEFHGIRGSDQQNGRQPDGIRSIGVSSLDTRVLDVPSLDPRAALSTDNYTKFLDENRPAFNNYLFGESKVLRTKSLRTDLKRYISGYGPSTQIILLGYNIRKELYAMKNIGIELQEDLPCIVAIIDTLLLARSQIPKRANDSSTPYLFESLLPEYGIGDIPGKYLYSAGTAGNFAYLDLKLLLAQVVRSFHDSTTECDPGQAARLKTLESISQASIQEELSRDTPDRIANWQARVKRRALKLQQRRDRKACVLAQRGGDWYESLEGGIDIELELESCSESVR